MASIKLTYIGGGSTRAPGTVAAIVLRGSAFAGSEVTLVDLDEGRLDIVRRIAEGMARARGVDLRIRTTTDRTRRKRTSARPMTAACRWSLTSSFRNTRSSPS